MCVRAELCVFSKMIMRKGKKDAQNIRKQGWRERDKREREFLIK